MLTTNMTLENTPAFFAFRRLSMALLATSAMSFTALAQSLPDISPEKIADDVERRYNAHTGETEYIGGTFDPFEGSSDLVGSASLRSHNSSIAIDGQHLRGGATLDVAAVYTANSADSFDVRGYQEVNFYSGKPASIIRYDRETLDCSRNTHVVSYDDGYYRGASYGYIAGLYRIYPRYRGHRHFSWDRGHWNRGYYTSLRPRRGLGHNTNRRRLHTGRPRDNDDARRGRRTGVHADRTRSRSERDARRGRRNADARADNARRVPREDTGEIRRRRVPGSDAEMRRRPPSSDNARRGRRPRGDTSTPNAPTADARPATAQPPRNVRKNPNKERRVVPPKRHAKAPKTDSRPKNDRPKVNNRPRVNRAVDRSFKRNRTTTQRHKKRNFYPMASLYARPDVRVSYRCVKEEKLSIHIPQDRLEAARFDGFAVMLVDNAGREVPVFIPPNYVEGFLAASANRRQSSAPVWQDGGALQAPTPIPAPAPQPSSREPIIYGDPNPPQYRYPQN